MSNPHSHTVAPTHPIRTLLIANRGEIARRIIRTARRLGIRSIAVYSDADYAAPFVQEADEAIAIGPAPAQESYLVIGKIIRAAQSTGADAIHPGYGFLSENAAFAAACEAAGIRFIGPPVAAIRSMGSKSESKKLMASAGVPLVPGYHGDDQSPQALADAALAVGFPLLIKASAGGGGKGMRVVTQAADIEAAIAAAQREAKSAFGDDHLLMERYLAQPRHVEVQLLFDQHGNGRYLFDRDCSVQRRHQKIIEEAPAPNIAESVRKAMGDAAIRCGETIGYVGAGTVEFLLEPSGEFFFMEMNTRLQVEHPVTELVTGLDLVEWQIRVAEGVALPWAQADLAVTGHAIEARIYAEDTDQQFLPMTGQLHRLIEPPQLAGIRVDSGVTEGQEITPWYDPMLAKVIAWGASRAEAIQRLKTALAGYQAVGVTLNTGFVHRVLDQPAFANGALSTHFIEQHQAALDDARFSREARAVLSWLGSYLAVSQKQSQPASPWQRHPGWRLGQAEWQQSEVQLAKGEAIKLHYKLQKAPADMAAYHQTQACVRLGDHQYQLDWTADADQWLITLNEASHPRLRVHFNCLAPGDQLAIFANAQTWLAQVNATQPKASETADDHALNAPMHGRITQLMCCAGQLVTAGTPLVSLEAMKMEHTLKAPADGTVIAVLCDLHESVQARQPLIEFAATAATEAQDD